MSLADAMQVVEEEKNKIQHARNNVGRQI